MKQLMQQVLIPLVQGRFLFSTQSRCLVKVKSVLIPLVQGRFLFVNGNAADSARGVLSPLVQGRFLFVIEILKDSILKS